MDMYKKNKFLKLSEAARRMGVSRSCLIKWDTQKKIQIIWRKKSVAVITEGEIEKFLIKKELNKRDININFIRNTVIKFRKKKLRHMTFKTDMEFGQKVSDTEKQCHINCEIRKAEIRRGKW